MIKLTNILPAIIKTSTPLPLGVCIVTIATFTFKPVYGVTVSGSLPGPSGTSFINFKVPDLFGASTGLFHSPIIEPN